MSFVNLQNFRRLAMEPCFSSLDCGYAERGVLAFQRIGLQSERCFWGMDLTGGWLQHNCIWIPYDLCILKYITPSLSQPNVCLSISGYTLAFLRRNLRQEGFIRWLYIISSFHSPHGPFHLARFEPFVEPQGQPTLFMVRYMVVSLGHLALELGVTYHATWRVTISMFITWVYSVDSSFYHTGTVACCETWVCLCFHYVVCIVSLILCIQVFNKGIHDNRCFAPVIHIPNTAWHLLEIYPTQKLQVFLPSMLASCTTTSSLLVFSSSTADGRSGATQQRQGRAVKLSQCGYTSEMDIIGAKEQTTDSKAHLSQPLKLLKVFLIWLQYIQVPKSLLLERCVHCLFVWTGRRVSTLFAWITGGGWRQIRADNDVTLAGKLCVLVPSCWINCRATLGGPNCLHYWLAIAGVDWQLQVMILNYCKQSRFCQCLSGVNLWSNWFIIDTYMMWSLQNSILAGLNSEKDIWIAQFQTRYAIFGCLEFLTFGLLDPELGLQRFTTFTSLAPQWQILGHENTKIVTAKALH